MPDTPVPPLPATCSVDAIIDWLCAVQDEGDPDETDYLAMARAVRALLEQKVNEAVVAFFAFDRVNDADVIVARVLGAP